MKLQNLLTTLQVRQFHRDTAVETARTGQRGIEDLRTVRRRQDDNALSAVETIHLGKQLVQRLLTLIIA